MDVLKPSHRQAPIIIKQMIILNQLAVVMTDPGNDRKARRVKSPRLVTSPDTTFQQQAVSRLLGTC